MRILSKIIPSCLYGDLVAIKRVQSDKCGNIRWLCECDCCERQQVVRQSRLLKEETGCRSCSQLKAPVGELTRTFWHQVMYGAKLRDLQLEITMEEAWQLFLNQDRKCALTGQTLILSRRKAESTASLDRIDSLKGYTLSNLQWVHKRINKMKTDLPQDEFIALCRAVTAYFSVSLR